MSPYQTSSIERDVRAASLSCIRTDVNPPSTSTSATEMASPSFVNKKLSPSQVATISRPTRAKTRETAVEQTFMPADMATHLRSRPARASRKPRHTPSPFTLGTVQRRQAPLSFGPSPTTKLCRRKASSRHAITTPADPARDSLSPQSPCAKFSLSSPCCLLITHSLSLTTPSHAPDHLAARLLPPHATGCYSKGPVFPHRMPLSLSHEARSSPRSHVGTDLSPRQAVALPLQVATGASHDTRPDLCALTQGTHLPCLAYRLIVRTARTTYPLALATSNMRHFMHHGRRATHTSWAAGSPAPAQRPAVSTGPDARRESGAVRCMTSRTVTGLRCARVSMLVCLSPATSMER